MIFKLKVSKRINFKKFLKALLTLKEKMISCKDAQVNKLSLFKVVSRNKKFAEKENKFQKEIKHTSRKKVSN